MIFSDKKSETDMTKGNITSLIVSFAVPLLLGNIFQQLYNMVDTWVVGNFVGKNAFSAVGTLSSTINTLIGFFSGFSAGAGVVISQWFGAKNQEKVQAAVHTFVTVTLILCVVFTVAGIAAVPLMMRILKSPAEVAENQIVYLSIYFAGISGLLLYNMGASIFRAVGNSKLPFIFLVISTMLNILLDLVFVIVFHMGTSGVAFATIVSQGISAALVIIMLLRTSSVVRVCIGKLGIDRKILSQIIRIGLPSGVQQSITSFSNMFVQSYINFFGADVMGGWTAYTKVEQVFFLPMQSIGMAASTFTGQNYGCGQRERTRKGAWTALFIALASSGVLMTVSAVFAEPITQFFISGTEKGVISYGTLFMRVLMPFHLFACFHQVFAGVLRGIGKSGYVMAVLLFCFVVFRQTYLYIVTHFISNTVMSVVMAYPVGWMLCSILITAFFLKFLGGKDRQTI